MPGHAKRLMFGLWSFLRQFMYTKFIVVTDDDVDIRDWKEVVWAITTRCDPVRDTTLVDHTPIDYLDFASPVSGLGGKMGLDATAKWPGETSARVGTADRTRRQTRIDACAQLYERADATGRVDAQIACCRLRAGVCFVRLLAGDPSGCAVSARQGPWTDKPPEPRPVT